MSDAKNVTFLNRPPPELVPEQQCEVYRAVFQRAFDRQVHFAVGGAFALAFYTGLWRNTKDLDLYVLPEDRERMISVLTDTGLTDYYGEAAYDRRWIYRGVRDGNLVDVIWAMANQRAPVDSVWLDHGSEGDFCGLRVPLIAPEEMVWVNLSRTRRAQKTRLLKGRVPGPLASGQVSNGTYPACTDPQGQHQYNPPAGA